MYGSCVHVFGPHLWVTLSIMTLSDRGHMLWIYRILDYSSEASGIGMDTNGENNCSFSLFTSHMLEGDYLLLYEKKTD